jgi:CheY-like chemotaxis protein
VIAADAIFQDSLLAVLESVGFRGIGAESLLIGLQLATVDLPNLIVCDLFKLGVEAHNIRSALTRNHITKGIKCIFLITELDIRDRTKREADVYLRKPIFMDALLESVEEAMRGTRIHIDIPQPCNAGRLLVCRPLAGVDE